MLKLSYSQERQKKGGRGRRRNQMSNALSPISSVALNKSLNLCVPQFPHLYNEGNMIFFIGP